MVTPRRTKAGRLLDEPAVVYLSLERRLGGDTTPEFRRRLFAKIAAAPKHRVVSVGALKVDVGESRREVVERVKQLRRAERLVVSNPKILGGTPVFRATRIPVHRIAFLLRHGDTPEALRRSYPRLTGEMLAVAPIYAEAHPARGRPRK